MAEKADIFNVDVEKTLLANNGPQRRNKQGRKAFLCKCCVILTIMIGVVLLLIFVAFPFILSNSIKLQRKFLFMTDDSYLDDFTISANQYPYGARNFYVVVNQAQNITIGAAHFLPIPLLNDSLGNETFSYAQSLAQSDYPVILHFHGNGENRFDNAETYWKLREFFHVISFDYRSYGDSSMAELTEEGIVEDSTELYSWLRLHTNPDNIYIWGRSLGAALATHTLAKLHDKNISAKGLVLEAPFTTLREEIESLYLAKMFSWLPWFESTVLDGLERNGFCFNTSGNILKVDCPIMILHAEDDVLIPYTLGAKLAKTAQERRDPEVQGNVTFHLFSAQFNYNHWYIAEAPELVNYIRYHVDICDKFSNATRKEAKGKNS